MENHGKLILSRTIGEILKTVSVEDIFFIYESLETCPQPELGQYTLKTFSLAKKLGKTPIALGEFLAEALQAEAIIIAINQVGPYINILLSSKFLSSLILESITIDKKIKTLSPSIKHRYLIEHSQPNTHKELHIGHTRNSVLGDTLGRLLKHAGHHIYVENYHGDEGAHVAKCLWYMKKNDLSPGENEERGTWLGRIYVRATTELDSANDADLKIYKAEISNVLKQIEDKQGDFYQLWLETREWSLQLFHRFYSWLNISFDCERCESDVSDRSFSVVEEYLEKGVFIRSEGAIGADLSELDLGFCMLLKSDGRGLYATKDLALALLRFEVEKPDTCIYVVDNRQSHHFKQVFATLDLMGFKESERCFHLAYEMVETKNGAMSSRKGNIVPIIELIKQLQDRAYQIISQRYEENWDKSIIANTAEKIALAAIRYGMLKVDPESKIIFDMENWINLEGNTGPYLQYVYARMCSLQKRIENMDRYFLDDIKWEKLTKTGEQQLLAQLLGFNEAVDISCKKLKPNHFANYIYELAKRFNAFYTESHINNELDVLTKQARIALLNMSFQYFGFALDLIGIPRVEQM